MYKSFYPSIITLHANGHEELNHNIGNSIGHDHEHTGIVGLIDYFMFNVLRLDENSKIIKAISIGLSDLVNILLILFFVITIISFIQSFISYEKINNFVKKQSPILSILLFAVLGILAPTCICTTIPIFIGILSVGIPLYSAICFLISGSLINISSIAVLYNITGNSFTNLYIVTSIIISISVGIVIYIANRNNKYEKNINKISDTTDSISIKKRLIFSISNFTHTVKKTFLYILIGLIFSAVFAVYVPIQWVSYINQSSILFMFLGIFSGLIIHMDIISIAPLIKSMIDADISKFILIPFLISTAFFSIPSLFMLKNYIKVKSNLKIWFVTLILIIISGLIMSAFSI